MRHSAMNSKMDFQVKNRGTNMIPDYLNNVFEQSNSDEDVNGQDFVQDEQLHSLNNKQREDPHENANDGYSIQEEEKVGTDGRTDKYITSYVDPFNAGLSLQKRDRGIASTEVDNHSEDESFQLVRGQPCQADKLRKSQYQAEKAERKQYPNLYSKGQVSITSLKVQPEIQDRTYSFKDDLEQSDFKVEQRDTENVIRHPSNTQRMTARKKGKSKEKYQRSAKNTRLSKKQTDMLINEDINEIRKKELKQKKNERRKLIAKDQTLQYSREEMISNVCQIMMDHIAAAEQFIERPTQGALLFHENNFIRHEWAVQTTSGYSSTMPLFIYILEEVKYLSQPCSAGDLIMFMRRIFDRMQLATECIIISLIYLEKIIIKGRIELRYCNWKTLLFTAILLASKFWEDINFWNVDYVDGLNHYPLKSINRMESEFLSLCEFNLFVSAEMYLKYYVAVRELNNPLFSLGNKTGGRASPFNRFSSQGSLTQQSLRRLTANNISESHTNLNFSNRPLSHQSQRQKTLPVIVGNHQQEDMKIYPALMLDMDNLKIDESQSEEEEPNQTPQQNEPPHSNQRKSTKIQSKMAPIQEVAEDKNNNSKYIQDDKIQFKKGQYQINYSDLYSDRQSNKSFNAQ